MSGDMAPCNENTSLHAPLKQTPMRHSAVSWANMFHIRAAVPQLFLYSSPTQSLHLQIVFPLIHFIIEVMGRTVRDDFLHRFASLLRCHSQRFASAWPLLPLDANVARPMILDQHQSPLFGTISAEIRLLIYSHVLADEDRFLHIYRDLGGRKRLAHRRCRDCDSELPTWQHSCFGQWSDEKNDAYRITVTVTEDRILYIFLSCRRMYVQPMSRYP
jgi:hypothetical protein